MKTTFDVEPGIIAAEEAQPTNIQPNYSPAIREGAKGSVLVDPFRRRVARSGYPVAETIRLGTPIPCVECGGFGGTLRKVSDSPAVYAHDHAPHPPRRSLMTWRRHLALRS